MVRSKDGKAKSFASNATKVSVNGKDKPKTLPLIFQKVGKALLPT